MRLIRYLLLTIIALTPFYFLRRILYSKIIGFKLSPSSKIDMLNFLDVKQLSMEENSHIRGIGNIFMNLDSLIMDRYSRIGCPTVGLNLFRGTANKDKQFYPYAKLNLGKCALVESFNYFDMCADIVIGNNVVIGGIRSVFFTHAFFKDQFEPIIIGNNVYIGSNCRFQMGTTIGNDSVVGMGSVVVSPINDNNCFIAGVPAKVVCQNYGYDAKSAFALRNRVFYENAHFVNPGAKKI